MKKELKDVEIKKVTRTEFLNLMSEFRKNIAFTGCAFGNICYKVDESGSTVINKEKQLQKEVIVQITIGASYEKRINRDLIKQEEEANFTAQSMSGKEYINDERVLAKDTKTGLKRYLIATVENHIKPDTTYFHKGIEIEKQKAIEMGLFLPSYFTPKKTAGRGNQQESTNFHTINPNVDAIQFLILNKVAYVIED